METENVEITMETAPEETVSVNVEEPSPGGEGGPLAVDEVAFSAASETQETADPSVSRTADSSPSQEEPMEGTSGDVEAPSGERVGSNSGQDLADQAADLIRYYPGFDEAVDGADPAFQAMVAAGVPMRRAYEALHLEDLISGAMAYASRRTLERLAGAALAGQQRPEENGLRTGQPATPVFDPRSLTKEQAKALKDRVFRGEKIYL